jgi:hypothetical protein
MYHYKVHCAEHWPASITNKTKWLELSSPYSKIDEERLIDDITDSYSGFLKESLQYVTVSYIEFLGNNNHESIKTQPAPFITDYFTDVYSINLQ